MSATYPKLNVVVSSQLVVSPSDPKGNIPMAMVVQTPRGGTEPKVLLGKNGLKSFINEYGVPDLKYGKSGLYADTLLKKATDNLTVVRAVSTTSKYSGLLVKAKKGEENLTDLTKPFELDPVVSGISGLTEEELKNYNFPVYSRNREYDKDTI